MGNLRSRLVTMTGIGDLPLEGGHDVISFLPRKKQCIVYFLSLTMKLRVQWESWPQVSGTI